MPAIHHFQGSVPQNYDRYLAPVLFEPYAVDLVQRLKHEQVRNVLELACGTGRLTRHLAEIIPAGGSLCATDLNPGMLVLAKEKIRHQKVDWKIADAQDLPFPDQQFDHVVSQFGVMFFPDKQKAMDEVFRVLQPGGKFIFSTWESVEKNPRIELMWKIIYELFGNETPDFFRKGPHSFFDQEEIISLLAHAGFSDISIDVVEKLPKYNEPEDLVRGFADGSPIRNYLEAKEVEVQMQFRERLLQGFIEQDKTFDRTVPCAALVIDARK